MAMLSAGASTTLGSRRKRLLTGVEDLAFGSSRVYPEPYPCRLRMRELLNPQKSSLGCTIPHLARTLRRAFRALEVCER